MSIEPGCIVEALKGSMKGKKGKVVEKQGPKWLVEWQDDSGKVVETKPYKNKNLQFSAKAPAEAKQKKEKKSKKHKKKHKKHKKKHKKHKKKHKSEKKHKSSPVQLSKVSLHGDPRRRC